MWLVNLASRVVTLCTKHCDLMLNAEYDNVPTGLTGQEDNPQAVKTRGTSHSKSLVGSLICKISTFERRH